MAACAVGRAVAPEAPTPHDLRLPVVVSPPLFLHLPLQRSMMYVLLENKTKASFEPPRPRPPPPFRTLGVTLLPHSGLRSPTPTLPTREPRPRGSDGDPGTKDAEDGGICVGVQKCPCCVDSTVLGYDSRATMQAALAAVLTALTPGRAALAGECSSRAAPPGTAFTGSNIRHYRAADTAGCKASCCAEAGCRAFTFTAWDNNTFPTTDPCAHAGPCCFLKTRGVSPYPVANCTSGSITGPPPPPPSPPPPPAPTPPIVDGGGACGSDRDCHGGGTCTRSACVCDVSWTGHDCALLHLLPARYVTFRLNFHHFYRFELDLRGHIHVWGAAFSCLRSKLADIVLN